MVKGEIVLIPFPFTNLLDQKSRPSLVLHADNRSEDCIVASISSARARRLHSFDIFVRASEYNGLKTDSFIKTNKIATLEKKTAMGQLGRLEPNYMAQVDKKLKRLFRI